MFAIKRSVPMSIQYATNPGIETNHFLCRRTHQEPNLKSKASVLLRASNMYFETPRRASVLSTKACVGPRSRKNSRTFLHLATAESCPHKGKR